jgi:aspartate oxidase
MPLVTEAVRGDGAILIDDTAQRLWLIARRRTHAP